MCYQSSRTYYLTKGKICTINKHADIPLDSDPRLTSQLLPLAGQQLPLLEHNILYLQRAVGPVPQHHTTHILTVTFTYENMLQ